MLQFKCFHSLIHCGIQASKNMISAGQKPGARVIMRFYYMFIEYITIIPLALVGYEMIIAQLDAYPKRA